MDDSTENITALDNTIAGHHRQGNRTLLLESLMRSPGMPRPQQHELVQTFLTHGTDPAFGNRVGVRRMEGRVNDFDALRLKDSIEAEGECVIVVVNEEAHRHLWGGR